MGITCNRVLSMKYKDPQYPEGHLFKANVLKGAKFPEKTISDAAFEACARRNNRGGGGGHRGYNGGRGRPNWQPRIGFNQDRERVQLAQSSHRHLNHSLPSRNASQQNYQQQPQRAGGYQQRDGYQQQRGGYQQHSGGYQQQHSGGYQQQSHHRGGGGGHRGGYQYPQRGARGGSNRGSGYSNYY